MREIKFRAWDQKYNDIIGDDYIIFNGMIYRDDRDFAHGQNTNDIILMQYTGLKDKNGVEIYEGDIVKSSQGIGYVCYIDSYFRVFRPLVFSTNLCNEISKGVNHANTIEVIGNIYENPELLEIVK